MVNDKQPRQRRQHQRRQEEPTIVDVTVTADVTDEPEATTTARRPAAPAVVQTIVRTVTAPALDPATVTEEASAAAPPPATEAITTTAVNGAGNAITIVIQQITTTPTPSSADLAALLSRLGRASSTSTPASVNPALASILSASLAAQLSASAAALSGSVSRTNTVAAASATTGTTNDDGGLSTGAIVGIAIGALIAVLAAIALCMWALGAARHRRAREDTIDMMGPSNLPDPYASAFISREVPGSFVRFHDDDDDMASISQSQHIPSGAGSGSGLRSGGGGGAVGAPVDRDVPYASGPPNAYDDLSLPEDDYLDVQSQRPMSDYRDSRAYTATY